MFQFPGGLADHLREQIGARECATADFFVGRQDFAKVDGAEAGHALDAAGVGEGGNFPRVARLYEGAGRGEHVCDEVDLLRSYGRVI